MEKSFKKSNGKIGKSKLISRVKILIAYVVSYITEWYVRQSKLISRVKILFGGMLFVVAVYFRYDHILVTIFILAAAAVYAWDISSQKNSAIDVEKRINDLEKSVKEHEEKLEKLDDIKSDN